ncbi:Uncharacterised protein [Nocardia africana]|uniref:Uncharacterized protein n=1 Tax=Nocardia africana TaxID=134964 RepID=A0A378WX56_9NOCA|nr:Uncharacterised protein [Nocardia africana]
MANPKVLRNGQRTKTMQLAQAISIQRNQLHKGIASIAYIVSARQAISRIQRQTYVGSVARPFLGVVAAGAAFGCV